MQPFKSVLICDNVYRISDILGVFTYLVIGEKRACLIDTGYGFYNIKEYVKTLTNLDVFVILTHAHLDHASGASLFDEVYLNEKDYNLYQKSCDVSYRYQMAQSIKELKDLSTKDFNPLRVKPFWPLKDKQVFDLGGIHLETIAVRGHTQGMMCVLMVEAEIMLFGDACGVDTLLIFDEGSCVSEYKQSLLYLKTYEDRYRLVVRNHGTGVSNKIILDNVIELCDLILENKDDRIPVVSHGIASFLAKATDALGNRMDGVEGNLYYTKVSIK